MSYEKFNELIEQLTNIENQINLKAIGLKLKKLKLLLGIDGIDGEETLKKLEKIERLIEDVEYDKAIVIAEEIDDPEVRSLVLDFIRFYRERDKILLSLFNKIEWLEVDEKLLPRDRESLFNLIDKINELANLMDELRKRTSYRLDRKVRLNELDTVINEINEILNFKPKIWVKVIDKIVKKGWNRFKVKVTNESYVHAYNLSIVVRGNVETRDVKPIKLLKGLESQTLEIPLKPTELGEFPIDIEIKYTDWKGNEFSEKITELIEVMDSTPKLSASKIFPPEIAEEYEEVEYIGTGGFARVFKAKRKRDGKLVAVKVPISLDQATGKIFLREMENWSKLEHPNIVRLYDYNVVPIPYMEIELCDRSLAELQKPLEIDKACWIIFNVAEGLMYAHRKGIVHRDVKPQNIMLKDGIPKISDWGLSKVIAESKSTSRVILTPHYASPERISKKFGSSKHPKVDVWQLGVIFYELVTGELPFKGEDPVEIFSAITLENPILPSEINPEAKKVDYIIMRCLEKYQSKRCSLSDLQRALAEMLNVTYRKSLKESTEPRRSAYYCGELIIVNLRMKNLHSAYKFASDFMNYAGDLKDYVVRLCDKIKFWLEREIPDDALSELVKEAEILVHKVWIKSDLI